MIMEAETIVSPKSSHSKADRSRAISSNDERAVQFPPLESLTGFLLRCASNIADAAYYKQVGSAELTPRQLAILLSLQNGGSMTQAALSVVTRMDRSTINEMVPRMIERELISKSNSPDDKRAIHLSITNRGLKTLKEVLPPTILSQDMLLASLPKEYRRVFKHCLQMIIEANDADLSE
jgi:DNA-binding MarR family transcriptional regulator